MSKEKQYDSDRSSEYFGMRLTDCCVAHSTYHMDDDSLCCKVCWQEVERGEGDGSEWVRGTGWVWKDE